MKNGRVNWFGTDNWEYDEPEDTFDTLAKASRENLKARMERLKKQNTTPVNILVEENCVPTYESSQKSAMVTICPSENSKALGKDIRNRESLEVTKSHLLPPLTDDSDQYKTTYSECFDEDEGRLRPHCIKCKGNQWKSSTCFTTGHDFGMDSLNKLTLVPHPIKYKKSIKRPIGGQDHCYPVKNLCFCQCHAGYV